jgi:hypothetical protein
LDSWSLIIVALKGVRKERRVENGFFENNEICALFLAAESRFFYRSRLRRRLERFDFLKKMPLIDLIKALAR